MTQQNNNTTMTTRHNFKRGDRVMLKGDDTFLGTIIDVGFKSASIVWDCEPDEIYLQAYERIEHIDRRTAFLTRLQLLLREFDAEIVFHCNHKQETLATSIIVGKSESCRNEVYGVNSTNIMDFDKE